MMKEFEKWLHASKPKLNGRPREDAWRAALKWSQTVKKRITEEHQDSLYGCIEQSIAIDVELGDD